MDYNAIQTSARSSGPISPDGTAGTKMPHQVRTAPPPSPHLLDPGSASRIYILWTTVSPRFPTLLSPGMPLLIAARTQTPASTLCAASFLPSRPPPRGDGLPVRSELLVLPPPSLCPPSTSSSPLPTFPRTHRGTFPRAPARSSSAHAGPPPRKASTRHHWPQSQQAKPTITRHHTPPTPSNHAPWTLNPECRHVQWERSTRILVDSARNAQHLSTNQRKNAFGKPPPLPPFPSLPLPS